MLDLDHPNTKFIFQAAVLEDQICALLNKMESATEDEVQIIRTEIIEKWIPNLIKKALTIIAE